MFEQLGLGFKFPAHVHFIKPNSHGLPSLPPSWGKPLLGVLSCFCPKMATVLENKLLFGILECGCWPHKQVTTLAEVFAGDKRSLQSLSCYYPCVACMYPAFVWTSTKNVWNAQHALRWPVFGPSITWSRMFWPSFTWNLRKHSAGAKAFWPSIVVAHTA